MLSIALISCIQKQHWDRFKSSERLMHVKKLPGVTELVAQGPVTQRGREKAGKTLNKEA